ncbi:MULTISPECIES: ATP-dependent DNA ligase [Paenibacillus]|uniref:DNA ligase (ATP) n=1 Tax=Paenibacillus odorifer TaxID=189426 RepID=A0ABX3HTT3_9BACL|nr:RNA ligase family protein [Paenibacillus odorifer]OMD52766.1 DNA ligase [Paenibacillus odorifer]
MKLQPIIPFEPILAGQLPAGNQWIAQIKWDGVRMLSYYDGSTTQLINRRGNYRTAQYPELTDVNTYCKADSVILDGEIIALGDGKPSFHEVMRRDSLKNGSTISVVRYQVPVIYMIFDILFYNGQSTMDQPLFSRQQLLNDILLPHPHVQAVPSYTDPTELFAAAQIQSLEGIVCKDINSTYAPGGKDKRWQKRKIISDLTAVAGGVTFRDGIVNALLLGLYDDKGNLHYIGHAGPGKLTVQDKRDLTAEVQHLKIDQMPFTADPQRGKGAFWIKPKLVFKVHFLEWNTSGTLRQPVTQARVDLPPESCTMEQKG